MREKLDRRVTIERFQTSTNSFNEVVKDWREIATVWASKVDVSDGERMAGGGLSSNLTTRFQVRHSSQTATVSTRDRIVCEGQRYEIVGVKELGRRLGLEITAGRAS